MTIVCRTEAQEKGDLNLCDLNYVKGLHTSGLKIVPCGTNKRQRYKWQRDENNNYIPLSWEQLEFDFGTRESGFGVLCGFDGLECLDIEDESYFNFLKDEHPDVVQRCPVVKTPGGGIHVLYRVQGKTPKSQVLARDVCGAVLIETRGKGSYFVAPGSALSTHPTGKPYELVQGSLSAIPTIGAEDWEALHEWAKGWHEAPEMPVADTAAEVLDDSEHTVAIGQLALPVSDRKAQARRYLSKVPGTVQGQGADARCCSVAMKVLKGFGLPAEVALELLLEWGEREDQRYSDGRHYPWSEHQLRRKLDWASKTSYRGKIGDKLRLAVEPPATYEADPGAPLPHGRSGAGDEFAQVIERKAIEAQQPRKRRAFFLDELEAMPSPKWMVKGHFTEGAFVTIFGASGNYKSFVALDWAMSVAYGVPYLDKHPVVQGKVAYVVSEGAALFKKRARAWLLDKELDASRDIVFVTASYDLSDPQHVDLLLSEAKEQLGELPKMVVIDTLSRNFGGNDPNSTKDMQKFCSSIDLIREHGITAVVVHHTGWLVTDRERSASNLRDSADTSIQCEKLDDLQCRLTCKKQKDADEFAAYRLQGSLVDISAYIRDEEDEIRSALVFGYSGGESEAKVVEKTERTEKAFDDDIGRHLEPDIAKAKTADEIATLSGLKLRTVQYRLKNAYNDLLVGRTGDSPYRYYAFSRA